MAKRQWASEWVLAAAAVRPLPHRVRPMLLRLTAVRIGTDSHLEGGVRIVGGTSLTLGDRVFVNTGVLLDVNAPIVVEDGVSIACDAKLITTTHEPGPPERRAGVPGSKPVRIGAGTWIGAGAIVLPGVTVAPGCVVAAGAVVTANTAPDGLYAGVPARRVRDLVAAAETSDL
ncbi:acyltransferase [Demequina sp.]|uniref:acyltransferase n=1 Tax=Demequina sp. TaxID=2050685 RepID=UPI003A87CF9B